jgi:hypothetical protein
MRTAISPSIGLNKVGLCGRQAAGCRLSRALRWGKNGGRGKKARKWRSLFIPLELNPSESLIGLQGNDVETSAIA